MQCKKFKIWECYRETVKPDRTLTWRSAIPQVKVKGNSLKEIKSMAVRQRRHSKEELAQRGQELYESGIREQVEAGNKGKIVAIDIETGHFELADETMEAARRLYERIPDAQPWVLRIGYRAVHRFGARSLKDSL